MINPIHWFHQQRVHRRRVSVLADWIASRLPPNATVLDVGCGDGTLAAEIVERKPDATMRGIDVLVRDETAIPVEPFDGTTFPLEDDQVDTILMIDVLHHTEAPLQLLSESRRVARQSVIIKDHYLRGFAAQQTLAFMDHIGNARHGVALPCNYLTPDQWTDLFQQAELRVRESIEYLGLYPVPLRWFFERQLHFLAVLDTVDAR